MTTLMRMRMVLEGIRESSSEVGNQKNILPTLSKLDICQKYQAGHNCHIGF